MSFSASDGEKVAQPDEVNRDHAKFFSRERTQGIINR